MKSGAVEIENWKIKTTNRETETKNKKVKANIKNNMVETSKLSNHIKFVDYIPTHEVITYRHLLAFGFYIV